MEHFFSILYRVFAGAVLCVFAFAPAWIGFGVLVQIVAKPSELDLAAVGVIGVCSALLYFLLLFAYRAFTGRGRKADGGLLPPWAMKFFVAAYGIVAVLIVAFGLYSGKWGAVLGGVFNLLVALSTYRFLVLREQQRRLNA